MPSDNQHASFAGPSNPSNGSGGPPSTNKKKKHRAGRKHRRPRRKSFAAFPDDDAENTSRADDQESRGGFYRQGRNLSNTSLESEALLDHREYQPMTRPRRPSILSKSVQLSSSKIGKESSQRLGPIDHDEDEQADEGAPLLSRSFARESSGHSTQRRGYGLNDSVPRFDRRDSSRSSRRRGFTPMTPSGEYNVNYPPSVPGSPQLGAVGDRNYGDEMMREELSHQLSGANSFTEGQTDAPHQGSPGMQRRHTIAEHAQDDVCYPHEGMSELGDDYEQQSQSQRSHRGRRRRRRWPDLKLLEEWTGFEQSGKSEEVRIKKIIEPLLINGRMRPVNKGWFVPEEDAPYRLTYFCESMEDTIHCQSISELLQEGTSFRDLFLPDPPVLSDTSEGSDSEEETHMLPPDSKLAKQVPSVLSSRLSTRQPSLATMNRAAEPVDAAGDGALSPKQQATATSTATSRQQSGDATPIGLKSPALAGLKSPSPRPIRYGDRPIWWLDILSPTEAEMKVLQGAFGIHPLTSEDIMLQEQREKVELFRHYYFLNYRSFDQDAQSETYLEPINVYVIVFREGVISFHFRPTPHGANVRRRIRQMRDYIVFSADWICYAIIDDITDVFVPLIEKIEDQVDDIDDAIMSLHRRSDPVAKSLRTEASNNDEKGSQAGDHRPPKTEADMMQRIGDCRKKVMELYRLLGTKADVIKGFAKRCNEHWDVAPRSDIGLYLGDIQDHIVTMTGNLGHYEKILARSHQNYLAQINIRMTERSEQTADTLGKLTVLGTIVLPMNIITGLWGMNVWVPGQDYEGDLTWFWCITAGLLCFGAGCYILAKRVYKIV